MNFPELYEFTYQETEDISVTRVKKIVRKLILYNNRS